VTTAALEDIYAEFGRPGPEGPRVVAHLGSSLDGRIATASGHSSFVTGQENLLHMHRLRALADAVLVGAGTVAHDDPQLTVRLVAGRSPLRVILDPDRRLQQHHRVFGEIPPATLLLCRTELITDEKLGDAEVLGLPSFTPAAVLGELSRRGVRSLFVEGGGQTVSWFLQAGCLDQLQICIAPVIIGSGRPSLALPAIATMAEALRPATRTLAMGNDVLFVCDLQRSPIGPAAPSSRP
jgi:diaminohydroxyphosphoribosylaminopyrimidine deaminase/5-amino-6-(5-phosphoribosylamino)uracil reductase